MENKNTQPQPSNVSAQNNNTKKPSEQVVSLPILGDLEKVLVDLNAKLPNLPPGIKEFLVKIAPYLALVGAILQVLAVLSLIGLSSAALTGSAISTMMGHTYGYKFSMVYVVSIVFGIAGAVLDFMAFPKLKVNNKIGWDYMYYVASLSVIHSLILINPSNLVGTLIGIVISYYLLFQLRSYYKYAN